MKKFQILFLVMFLSLLSSCCWLGGSGREIVTTSENISPTYTGCVEVFPNSQLPDPLKSYWSDQMVLKVSENALKSPDRTHAILGETNEAAGDPYLQYGWSVLTTLFPGLLAFEGMAALLIRRKRKHYVAAIKNLIPHDGVVDVKGAATDVARALGLAHSSPTTKEIFESEVANKGNPTPS